VAAQVLFVYNDPNAPEAVLGEVFTENGFDISTFNVVPPEHIGNPAAAVVDFPDPSRYDVIVPLGSRWSVHDDALCAGWVGAEMAMVRAAVDAGVGVLGVCFGGQLVAQALGGTVRKAPSTELGWYPMSCSEDARTDLVGQGPWFEWHSDQFTAPPGATELARTAHSSQAFVIGTALGLQFHPELNSPLLELWLDGDTKGHGDTKGDGDIKGDGDLIRLGIDADELRARTRLEERDAAQRLRTLVGGFLDRVARPALQA
jgi:GMP synthase-like glutamine amidotransferase